MTSTDTHIQIDVQTDLIEIFFQTQLLFIATIHTLLVSITDKFEWDTPCSIVTVKQTILYLTFIWEVKINRVGRLSFVLEYLTHTIREHGEEQNQYKLTHIYQMCIDYKVHRRSGKRRLSVWFKIKILTTEPFVRLIITIGFCVTNPVQIDTLLIAKATELRFQALTANYTKTN